MKQKILVFATSMIKIIKGDNELPQLKMNKITAFEISSKAKSGTLPHFLSPSQVPIWLVHSWAYFKKFWAYLFSSVVFSTGTVVPWCTPQPSRGLEQNSWPFLRPPTRLPRPGLEAQGLRVSQPETKRGISSCIILAVFSSFLWVFPHSFS